VLLCLDDFQWTCKKGHAVTYSSGLAAVYAAMVYYLPKRLIISKEGYHGTHDAVNLYKRTRPEVVCISLLRMTPKHQLLTNFDLSPKFPQMLGNRTS
jgi:cystathionine beta-lyase/cystathionine gamma-synthase